MLALDVLLLLMISICVVYCWVLNRRIRDLHNSRAEFASMIKAFDSAVVKAENCIADLSVLGKNSTAQVKKAADTAHEVIEELKTVYAIGDKVGTKLESSIMEARKYQKSLEEAHKTQRQATQQRQNYQVEELYADEVSDDAGLSYDDLPKSTIAEAGSRYGDDDRALPQNLLEKVLDKINTHHQTIGQNDYYKTLRKVSLK